MSENVVEVVIQLRKDTEANYDLIKDTFIPANGEVCFIDTTNNGLRTKVGDGTTTFGNLDYYDNYILRGYYYEGKFYTDKKHTSAYVGYENKLYIDITDENSPVVYGWTGSNYYLISKMPALATSVTPGLVKLYNTNGSNTDGSMDQASVSNGISQIALSLDETIDECISLKLPW